MQNSSRFCLLYVAWGEKHLAGTGEALWGVSMLVLFQTRGGTGRMRLCVLAQDGVMGCTFLVATVAGPLT